MTRLADSCLHILLLTSLMGAVVPSAATAAPPPLKESDAVRFEKAAQQIRSHLAALQTVTPTVLRNLESQLREINRGVTLYFHAPNIRDKASRPRVLRMRAALESLRKKPAVLVLSYDVFRFSASVHHKMAAGYRVLGDIKRAQVHEQRARLADRKSVPLLSPHRTPGPVLNEPPLEVSEPEAAK